MNNFHLEEEIQREIELNLENEKLEESIAIINKEIVNLIHTRKHMVENIMEYRKQVLDEYKDDEDKVAEFFDHERFIAEEQFKFIDKKLKELTILTSSPYFGKVCFIDEEYLDEECIYIGRFGVTPKGAYEPLIIDWRSPVAALFYAGKLGEVTYTAPVGEIKANILGKTQLIIKKGKLLGIFHSAVDVKDEILQMVLSSNSSDKLKDIIMTIQQEQDNLIRQPKNRTIVVDGVAGSGKTTVALHRVAYLLYNYRKSLQDKVLILGPNNIFMEYISTVLPSLGEVGVRQMVFKDFASELIGVDNIMSFQDYMENIISENSDFINKILYKTSKEYIQELDNLVTKLNESYFEIMDIEFLGNIIVSKEEIEKMFNEYFSSMPLFRRSKRIKRIIYSKIKDTRNEKVREIEKNYKEQLSKLTAEEINLYGNDLEFKRRLEIRNIISEVIRIKNNLQWIKNPNILDMYVKFNKEKELTQDDLAPILYLKIKLEGLSYPEEIKHVVIDEAQDYSALQFIVIKHLTKCQSLTIVGDSNQRLIPINNEIPMNTLNEYLEFEEISNFKLQKSYRSTQEIMKFSNKYLNKDEIVPLVRNGEEVRVSNVHNESELTEKLVAILKQLKEKGYESVAVICKDISRTEYISSLIKQKMYIKVMDKENVIYNSGEIIIPSYFAKGLEFDAVIIIDDNSTNINYNKMMYVMATRALHELFVFNLN
ncbi:DNA helicase-2/ATP-dependent DNA helicase PcrA [Clostridium tetanomorphum]|uniref:AAA family ATPase n=1 Tax=Clostridium tetanomorphum TaxID=1553 RepID=A0A923ECZ5_CLOTT|nr:UvrD-helicase domain-containing protein [Clostridium tetanomorphum]KAJ49042.1 ATP-dependent DNA helicase rep [Clostridium tetanomorphum DSM 665]KAJ51734.1 ATP-dependent DNA helicase rep [Clostridium tetanomorphum DSM 665]MBC2399091.1 AAA family ATPase [Clostridium tetanomorphum]MBP1865900.1 DNA helicase-2/ATP-dependent DNA helicase PcrA [Clostridium tetanomorphum]NRS86081.1 DNA helicase-2/ATP-dependent DNA helicase PcrA [Clostridium tetanomorphum]